LFLESFRTQQLFAKNTQSWAEKISKVAKFVILAPILFSHFVQGLSQFLPK